MSAKATSCDSSHVAVDRLDVPAVDIFKCMEVYFYLWQIFKCSFSTNVNTGGLGVSD